MFPHRGRLLSLATVVLLLTLNAQAQDTVLQAPGHSERDMWEYLVEGKLGSLAGPMNLTGSLDVEGLAMAEVKGVEGPRATIEWNSQLSVAGNITLPPEFDSNTAYVDGTISTTQVQTRESSFFLPLSIRDTTDFDLTVSYIVPVPYSAGLELLMDITPTPSFPEYPLGVGEKEVEFIAHVESALSMSFFGFSIENSSTGDLTSSLRLNITPASEIRVPAGEFRAVRVVSSADEGLVPGLFPFPFAGALQVGYYSNEVGNAVLFQFFLDDVEVGNATLRSFSYSPLGGTPLWQHPAFIGGLLLVPAAVLIYRYWRERRRGL